MRNQKNLGLIVATIALAILTVSPVFAQTNKSVCGGFACIDEIQINGIEAFEDETAGIFAGERIPVRVTFTANSFEEDVRVVARILGEPGFSEVTERFNVLEGSTYSRLLNVEVPFDLDEKKNEPFTLLVTIESNAVEGDSRSILLEVQRSNFELEVLSVDSDTEVRAGDILVLDVVIKNRGFEEAEDTFVTARIPELGISKRIFLGDLSSQDQDDPEKFDSDVGRIFLKIPSDAAAGVYDIEVETFTDDAKTIVTKKVAVTGAGEGSRVISSSGSKTFAVGEQASYSITVVNAGNSIAVYELILESNPELQIEFEESVFAVPSGASKTVKLNVVASKEGKHDFAVNVHSDGQLVQREAFVANTFGRGVSTGNAAFLLTVILAIIFVVLLIVLIVLLTRKPEKAEEFGESYY